MINYKRIISMILVVSMIMANNTVCFADSSVENSIDKIITVQDIADDIEDVTGTNDICNDISYDNDGLVADGEEVLVDIPNDGSEAISVNDGEGATYEMKLPIEASDDDGILTKNGTMIYGKEDDAVTIGVQPLKDETGNVSFEGVRTLITINESTASKEYDFAYDLPEGYSLITAKDYYRDIIDNEAVNENDYDTGEVYIVNKDNVIDTVIDAAWAVDANGNDVDTYYVVNGNILTQVVNFDEKTAFPVIADPSAWKIAKCAAAIGLVVAGTIIAAAKVAKVVKYIKALGGVKKAAKLVVLAYAAGDAKKYARHIGGSFKNLCEIILGIDTIKSQCKF